jgi:hypothetical protein
VALPSRNHVVPAVERVVLRVLEGRGEPHRLIVRAQDSETKLWKDAEARARAESPSSSERAKRDRLSTKSRAERVPRETGEERWR